MKGACRGGEPWRSLPTVARRAAPVFLAVLCAFALLALARETVLGFYRVHGVSMEPTLDPGAYVFADKAAFGSGPLASLFSSGSEPRRGQVVVFALRPGPRRYIKRVVGLPGDTLAMRDGHVCVNGQPLAEPYLAPPTGTPGLSDAPGFWHFSYLLPEKQTHRYQPTGLDWGPLVVPRGAFFVLGDHRNASGDSRDFGFVHRGELVARPFAFWK